MSYNGVGLSTARGSGTNGYVQKNLSSIKSKPIFRKDAVNYLTAPEHQARSGNSEILTHEKKRQVEIKCLELEDKLTAQGMDEDEIEDEIDQLRQVLYINRNCCWIWKSLLKMARKCMLGKLISYKNRKKKIISALGKPWESKIIMKEMRLIKNYRLFNLIRINENMINCRELLSKKQRENKDKETTKKR
jgi:hypothetical protein